MVYEPNALDSQNDWTTAEEIEKMAHGYLRSHLETGNPVADLNHEEDLPLDDVILVESFIAPVDYNINQRFIYVFIKFFSLKSNLHVYTFVLGCQD